MARLLITGGAGFLGSHTCLLLLQAGYGLVVLDSFANSSPDSLERVVRLAGGDAAQRLTLLQGDIRCRQDLERAFREEPLGGPIKAVLHFAGLKAVAESSAEPLRYWDVNVGGSRLLLEVMQERGCFTLVFSSSATVYGMPEAVPIPETAHLRPINPYGHTKAAVEQLLADLVESRLHSRYGHASASASHSPWRIARLRYFNPVGAHPSGQLGEDPQGTPSNLFPLLGQVALGQRPQLDLYGDDWPTADGSGERDYIHVMDLAEGHLATLQHLQAADPGLLTLNLGSGQGHTVKQVVQAYAQACGRSLPIQVVGRRVGDAACSVADPSRAQRLLGWQCRRTLQQMCSDSWRWQSSQRGRSMS